MGFIFPSIVHEGCILLWPPFNCCLVSILLSCRLTLPQKTQEETALATAIVRSNAFINSFCQSDVQLLCYDIISTLGRRNNCSSSPVVHIHVHDNIIPPPDTSTGSLCACADTNYTKKF